MNQHIFPGVAALCLSALTSLACSSSQAPASTPGPTGSGDAAAPGRAVTFTMKTTVAPGSETHECQYVTAPASGSSYVVAGSHVYTPGSHHMLLFRTDLTAVPAGEDGVADCYEGATGFMSHVRGLVYGAQVPTGQMVYPAGVGLPLVAGEVFVMQTHYLNAGSAPLDARADVTLTLSDGSDITTHAGILFFYDPFIDVPPGMKGARAATRCRVARDVTLISASSHFHKRGYDYAAFVDPASGPSVTTPFYTSSDWDHPTSLASPLQVLGGSRIRFQCAYDNSLGTKEYFQGQSAEDDEMCMFIATYYPAMTLDDELCTHDRDMIGTGAATCGATLTCLQACPARTTSITPGTGKFDVDPCTQKCIVASCPSAGAKLVAINNCITSSCPTECASPNGGDCQGCVVAKCALPALACSNDACQ